MRLTSFIIFVLFGWCTAPAIAGMVWAGVAVDPSMLSRLRKDASYLEQTLESDAKGRTVYLDKSWHGIHYLLTGSAGPTKALSSKVIFGGESVGPDQGYGPAQILSSDEVKMIAKLLSKETPEVLAKRYDPQALERADIYPDGIWVREGPEAWKYVLAFYKQLVLFYQQAAERGDAVVFVVH